MSDDEVESVAAALQLSLGLFVRTLRQTKGDDGELTLPESSALSRLDRGGPASAAELARAEQISPQSMGATVAALEERGLLTRRADPNDGRRSVMSVTAAGQALLRSRRSARGRQIASALERDFSKAELRTLLAAAPLIERLAHSI